jgi:hypothetical protein
MSAQVSAYFQVHLELFALDNLAMKDKLLGK